MLDIFKKELLETINCDSFKFSSNNLKSNEKLQTLLKDHHKSCYNFERFVPLTDSNNSVYYYVKLSENVIIGFSGRQQFIFINGHLLMIQYNSYKVKPGITTFDNLDDVYIFLSLLT